MAPSDWKRRLERFFYERGEDVGGVPTLLDHCRVSAKNPWISGRPEIHADMIESIVRALALNATSTILEVGCASGYVACGLAPRVGRYTGVDLASPVLKVARRMRLPNADFRHADGADLPFASGSFDAALAYDVFTNCPTFDDTVPLLSEMLRVVKPGGRVMIGSLTDARKASKFEQVVREVNAQFQPEHSVAPSPKKPNRRVLRGLRRLFLRRSNPPEAVPEILVYYFEPGDFRRFAESRSLGVVIADVHPLNPYVGFRYNVVLTKAWAGSS